MAHKSKWVSQPFSFSSKGSPTLILNGERSHSSFQITKILVTGKSFLPRKKGDVTHKNDLELVCISGRTQQSKTPASALRQWLRVYMNSEKDTQL
jgi:hypothetical protein